MSRQIYVAFHVANENRQTTLNFSGALARPVRPGPLPGRVKVHFGAPMVGGVNEMALLRTFAVARTRISAIQARYVDADGNTKVRRKPWTREEKLAAVDYAEETWVASTID